MRQAIAAMDDEARRFSLVAAAVHAFVVLAGYSRLARTPDSALQGPRWLWRVLMPASIITVDGKVTVIPIGVVLFWALGRRRRR